MKKIIVLLIFSVLLIFHVRPSIAGSTLFTEEITKLNTLDADFMKGCSNASLGKHREAIDAFSRVIYRDQYDSAAYYRRGLSYLAINNQDMAIQDFEYAMGGVDVDPRSILNYKNMDSIFERGSDPKTIITLMDKAIKEHPGDADAFYNRGTAYLVIGKLEKAINDFNKAIDLKPQDLDCHYNRKVALQRSDASQRLRPPSAAEQERRSGKRDEPTKVKIIGNAVFVPVTLVYGGNQVDVYLLLDTGSTGTAIHTEIADQLSINLNQARKTKVRVVGGDVLEASVVKISSLTIGPYTKRDWGIFVVPHKSPVERYGGLLGMDVLRELKYEVDFKKQIIVWR
jgi:predicted aspartyl protease